tara:strand:- start:351 stop:2219 length:1869 start_codon:yes stop_codon:yes gene_type:complete
MAIGRPITLSPNVATKRISVAATEGQTAFTPAGGYRANEIAVYRNGVRLVDGRDFTARDGALVTLLSAATIDDIIDFAIFDSFNVTDTINSNGDSTLIGDLTITGVCSATTLYGDGSNITGIGVTSSTVTDRLYVIGLSTQVGMSTFKNDVYIAGVTTAIGGVELGVAGVGGTIRANGDVTLAGVVTASSFVGGGANLTALSGSNIASGTVAAARVATLNQNTSGTAGGLSGTPDITIRNITGVAATFTGTLSYENLVNQDVIGLGTFRTGLNVGSSEGGGAGVAITMSSDGNAEFTGIVTANALKVLGSQATNAVLEFYADEGDDNADKWKWTAGNSASEIYLQNYNSGAWETNIKATGDASVEIYYNNSKKWETTETGTITTGISTADGFSVGDNEYITAGIGSDLSIYHNAGDTNNYIKCSNDNQDILIQSSKDIYLATGDGGTGVHTVLYAADNAGVELRYDNSKKIETLSTGVKVTGITSTTQLTVGPGLLQESFDAYSSALNSIVNHDVLDHGMVLNAATNASASFTINLRGDGSTTFNSLMNIGQTTVFTVYSASNNTSYYLSNFQIDGSGITEKWSGAEAPSAGTGSGVDCYTFNILKTADATFTIFANFVNFG